MTIENKIDWLVAGPGIEAAEFSSAQSFLDALRLSKEHWWDGDYRSWVFRGHSSSNWKLLPSAWRPDNKLIQACRVEAQRRFDLTVPKVSLHWWWPDSNIYSRPATFSANDPKLGKSLAVEVTAELLTYWDFASSCNQLGIAIPLVGLPPDPAVDPNHMHHGTAPLLADDFLRFADLPRMLALAQHHGLPTRLLDWTYNSIAAAFFAVENLKSPTAGDDLVVWALHRQRAKDVKTAPVNFAVGSDTNLWPVDTWLDVYRPLNSENQYMSAQSGLFTSIRAPGIYYMLNSGERPCLETFVERSNPTATVLRKLMLPHSCALELQQLLLREGMSRSALMPTMDNIASDISKKWLAKTATTHNP